MPYKKLLVALACKEDESHVIREGIRLASSLNSSVTAFHVNDPNAGKLATKMEPLPLIKEKDIRDQFRELGFEKEAEKINVKIIAGSSYPKEIAKATLDMDLLVIGHRQKHGFLSAFIDSVDKRIADMVSCPVVIVPRKDPRP